MQIRRNILLALAILLTLCSCASGQKTERQTLSEIYSNILGYHDWGIPIIYCLHYDLNMHIGSTTYTDPSWTNSKWIWAADELPGLEQETWENFVQVTSEPAAFPSDLKLGCRYTLRAEENADPYPPGKGHWDIDFSQVGFNKNRDQALAYFMRMWSGTATSIGGGYGTLYLLELKNGIWTVTGELVTLYNN